MTARHGSACTRRKSEEQGFTLMELIVGMALLSGITASLFYGYAVQSWTANRENANAMASNQIRTAMERVVRELQSAGFDPTSSGAFGFIQADAATVRFTTDANRDGVLQTTREENHGFSLSGGTLRTWLSGTSWTTLATGVQSLAFTYLDASGQTTTSLSAIREVVVTAGILAQGRSPGMPASLRTLTGIAYLRND